MFDSVLPSVGCMYELPCRLWVECPIVVVYCPVLVECLMAGVHWLLYSRAPN